MAIHCCVTHPCPVCNPPRYLPMPFTPRAPVLCPVCSGKTMVEQDFYPAEPGAAALNRKYVPCRTCNGKGVV